MTTGPQAGDTSVQLFTPNQPTSPSGISNLDDRIRELENKENIRKGKEEERNKWIPIVISLVALSSVLGGIIIGFLIK